MLLHLQLLLQDLPHLDVHLQPQTHCRSAQIKKAQIQLIRKQLCSHLVDPEQHGVFQVERQLLGGTDVGEASDTGHHLLHADHLQDVGHHQGIDEVDVGALEE